MVKSIEGIYRDGKVELLEDAPDVTESRVIVTFLSARNAEEQPSSASTPEERKARFRESVARLGRPMGPRTWTREQLHER